MKNKSMKTGIVFTILLLAVGFAAVTTTLVITGVIKIKADTEGFATDVKFASAELDATSVTAGSTVTLNPDGKSITLNTHTMKSIDETVTLTYTVVNGSQYAATFDALSCQATNEADQATFTKYFELTSTDALMDKYTAESPLAAGQTSDAAKLNIRLKRSYAALEEGDEETKSISFTCNLVVNGIEGTTTTTSSSTTSTVAP